MTTVYLVDDHEMILPGIKMIVESIDDFSVTGQASDGLTAVKEIQELEPDICVADLSIPRLNGFGISRKIKESRLKTKIILLTSYSDDDVIQEALQLQVAGYVLKENNSSELENALINVAKGYRYFSPRIMTRMADGFCCGKANETSDASRTVLNTLTSREKDILSLVAEGMSGKEICETLNISTSTMKSHKTNLLKKMDVKTTKELIILINNDKHLAGKIL